MCDACNLCKRNYLDGNSVVRLAFLSSSRAEKLPLVGKSIAARRHRNRGSAHPLLGQRQADEREGARPTDLPTQLCARSSLILVTSLRSMKQAGREIDALCSCTFARSACLPLPQLVHLSYLWHLLAREFSLSCGLSAPGSRGM